VNKVGLSRFEIKQGKKKWMFEVDLVAKWVEEIENVINS
jgi:hypothetical protein